MTSGCHPRKGARLVTGKESLGIWCTLPRVLQPVMYKACVLEVKFSEVLAFCTRGICASELFVRQSFQLMMHDHWEFDMCVCAQGCVLDSVMFKSGFGMWGKGRFLL